MPAYLMYTIFKKHLEVRIDGKGRPTSVVMESRNIWSNLKRLSEREDLQRMLIMVNVQQALPLEHCADIVQMALDTKIRKQSRIALLDLEGNNVLFMNLVNSFLQYVGFQTEVFRNKRSARRWLHRE